MPITTAINDVLALRDYTPNPATNHVMTQLVESVIDANDLPNDLQKDDIMSKVREISALTETELECTWAQMISSSAQPKAALLSFPYIDNYTELARRELALIARSGLQLNATHKALIIGSGPLPLSALELHRQSGASIDHVDSSLRATQLSTAVCDALGMTSRQYCAAGQSVQLEVSYDLVLIAALAGATVADKQAIIDNILPHLAKGGRIVIRSARGSRELLYPGIKINELHGVQKLAEYHPDDYIINSVFVYGREHEA